MCAEFSPDEILVERLAARLHERMEHLDPSGALPWGNLADADPEFYRACAESMLIEFRIHDRPQPYKLGRQEQQRT